MKRRRIALVVPRAGYEVTGGAEAFCLTAARALMELHDVEVLTSCAADYRTWANEFPEGSDEISGVPVRRFNVDAPRDPKRFHLMSQQLRYRIAMLSTDEQEHWIREQGPYSTALLKYIWDQRDVYDDFFFFTYLYPTTYFGLPLAGGRAHLVPLAHDEWPIYMPAFNSLFARTDAFIYVSPEERDFVRRRFRGIDVAGPLCHVPLHAVEKGDPERFRSEYGINGPFALYLGRVDESKGVFDLSEMFEAYAARNGTSLQLVVAGEGGAALPHRAHVRTIGFVDEQTKWDALSACDVFMMPSRYESLCLALLEAWACGKPAVVNGLSEALIGQCRRSNGGLWYNEQESFNAVLDIAIGDTGPTLGRQGKVFFDRCYRAGDVTEAFLGSAED